MHIAIVVSDFNQEITLELLKGALHCAQEKNISAENIKVVHVPGAVEIPLIAKKLAKLKRYEAIIALGTVIRGETSHYDYVCDQVSMGCQSVMLEYEIPVIFGVLTCDNEEQAQARVGGVHGHKGYDAFSAALAMIQILKNLQ